MLQAAAQRGVRVNIIVYKEVTQALTLSSAHTKHTLEALHPNIAVFRHPDHLPDRQELTSSITSSFQNMSLDSASLSKMSKDALKGLYGMNDDVILYWAHHEKLCLIDGQTAFMGGLDMCFGRWDTHQHAISDVHPSDLNQNVFPGQDYNNSRVLDFHDVSHWENNQLDRKTMSRMGWSDISVSLHGVVVEDLRRHFVERWNFIYDAKYKVRQQSRYARLALYGRPTSTGQQGSPNPQPQQQQQQNQQPQSPYPSGQASPHVQQPSWQAGNTSTPTYSPATGQTPTTSQPQQQSSTSSNQYQAGNTPTYPPPPSQAQQNQNQQQAYNPSTYQSGNVPTYPPPPGQTSSSPQPQQQQSSTPSWQTGSGNSSSYPPPPSQTSASPQPYQHQQHQQSSTPSYQRYQGGNSSNYAPPPTELPGNSQSPPNYSSHTPSQSSPQYTYTGDSFPPPPAGPPPSQSPVGQSYQGQQQQTQNQAPYYAPPPTQSPNPTQSAQGQSQVPYYPPPPGQENAQSGTRGISDYYHRGDQERGFAPRRLREDITHYGNSLRGQLAGQIHTYQDRLTTYGRPTSQNRGNMSCQIVRSCCKWSNGSPLEHSIQDAYAAVIKNSEHFVYIENQFFITATGDHQHPVKNKIGAAIVERILRAARAGQKYKIIVVIPSVPCFAGDLRDDETLGTRAIMEFQYYSINRGGNSIMELIAKEGFNPMEYIRFYNLRNYDRINNAGLLAAVEQQSGVNYGNAQRQYDVNTAGPGGYAPAPAPAAPAQGATRSAFDTSAPFEQYQQAAHQVQGSKGSGSGKWDSVSSCYMLNGEDIRNVPWDGHPDSEIDAFVSEELYVHSKVCSPNSRVKLISDSNSIVGDDCR